MFTWTMSFSESHYMWKNGTLENFNSFTKFDSKTICDLQVLIWSNFLKFCGFEQIFRFCQSSSQNLILCRKFQKQILLEFTDNVQILIFHVWSGIAREGNLGDAFRTYVTKGLLIRNTWAIHRDPFVCFTHLLKPK